VFSSGRSDLTWYRVSWLVPAALGTSVAGFLCWGAWQAGYDPRWPKGHGTWVSALRPDQGWALPVTLGLWLTALGLYWWPRRYRQLPVGLIAVAVMVVLAVVLGAASYVPCRGGLSTTGVAFWVLQLFVGQPAPVYPGAGVCTGPPPPGLQVAQVLGLGATLTGALAAGAALWRPPVQRLRSLLTRDATVFTGLDPLTLPLLRRLTETARSPRQVIVIEPDHAHPLLEEARATGARIIAGDPGSLALLDPVIAGRRGPALSHLYALRSDDSENEAVLRSARGLLRRYPAAAWRQPHLVARIDDVRYASYWRAAQSEPEALVFEDALSVHETTARALAGQVLSGRPRAVLLCGSGGLSLALVLELARRSWEEAELAAAVSAGQDARSARDDPGETGSAPVPQAPLPALIPVDLIMLLDPHSADIRRDFLQIAPQAVLDKAPAVTAHARDWQRQLLRSLDSLPRAAADRAAVVITDSISDADMHEIERVARVHAAASMFIPLPPAGSGAVAAFYGLYPFAPGLLVDGEIPEDTWTRVARHWHDCYRLSHPLPPGHPKAAVRVPWPDLDPFLREDNLLELRSIMSAAAALGRLWVPAHMVPRGSFIELGEREVEQVAEAEHTRWLNRRFASGLISEHLVPWTDLPPSTRTHAARHLRAQLAQLEDIGFLPIVPVGGPPEALTVEHTGTVTASQLKKHTRGTSRAGQPPHSSAKDWRLIDDEGEPETMTGTEFLASHEPAGDGRWQRTGTFRAWQASEKTIVRTKNGKATANPGDWIVEAADGARQPVSDRQFHRRYQPRA
jgi:hypothetical protein